MTFSSAAIRILGLSTFILLFTSFSHPGDQPDFQVIQKNRIMNLENTETSIQLKKNEFELIFRQKEYNPDKQEFYSTQVAFTLEKKDLSKIREGVSTSEIEFFSPGTGFATSGHYRSSFINSGETVGHHYFIYQKSGEQRANLVKEKDGMLVLKHKVNTFVKDSKSIKIKKVNFPELYMVLFSDRNLNQVMDKGEYRIVTIKFV